MCSSDLGAELTRIAADHCDAASDASRLLQDLNAFELTAMKVEMRVPEYREAKEDIVQTAPGLYLARATAVEESGRNCF